MTKKIIFLALSSLLFAPCSAVEAQRPTKIPRIGVLDTSTASSSAAQWQAFRARLPGQPTGGFHQALRQESHVEAKSRDAGVKLRFLRGQQIQEQRAESGSLKPASQRKIVSPAAGAAAVWK